MKTSSKTVPTLVIMLGLVGVGWAWTAMGWYALRYKLDWTKKELVRYRAPVERSIETASFEYSCPIENIKVVRRLKRLRYIQLAVCGTLRWYKCFHDGDCSERAPKFAPDRLTRQKGKP